MDRDRETHFSEKSAAVNSFRNGTNFPSSCFAIFVTSSCDSLWPERPAAKFVIILSAQTLNLTFTSLGSGDKGPILDSVQISTVSGVPEPASMSLIGAGLVGLGLLARRRNQFKA